MTVGTFFTETKFPLVPAEVKSTKTRNGTQMVGMQQSRTPR